MKALQDADICLEVCPTIVSFSSISQIISNAEIPC